jgi:hypothetical protein
MDKINDNLNSNNTNNNINNNNDKLETDIIDIYTVKLDGSSNETKMTSIKLYNYNKHGYYLSELVLDNVVDNNIIVTIQSNENLVTVSKSYFNYDLTIDLGSKITKIMDADKITIKLSILNKKSTQFNMIVKYKKYNDILLCTQDININNEFWNRSLSEYLLNCHKKYAKITKLILTNDKCINGVDFMSMIKTDNKLPKINSVNIEKSSDNGNQYLVIDNNNNEYSELFKNISNYIISFDANLDGLTLGVLVYGYQ